MIHRWHAPHYEMVPVYLWPWLFWQLWQIDRWTEYTGRQVFVEVDRQGRAYSTSWEGMDLYWDEETGESYRPWRMSDLQELLPKSPLWRDALLGSAHPGQAQRDPGSRATNPEALMEVPDQDRDCRHSFRLILGLPPPIP